MTRHKNPSLLHPESSLDPRLADDCTLLGYLPGCQLLMLNATSLPWLILVPNTDKTEIFELVATEQQLLLENTSAVSAFIKKTYSTDNINVASIGNIVSQLHVHVIGRFTDDFCWPNVVWGVPDNDPPITTTAGMTTAIQHWFGDKFRTAPTA